MTIVLDLLVPHMATSQICQDGRPCAIQFQQRPLNNHWESGCFTTKNASHELDLHMIRKGSFNKHVLVAFISEHNIYRPWLLKKRQHQAFKQWKEKHTSNWSGINFDVVDVLFKVIIFPSRTFDNVRLVVACCLTRMHGHVGVYLGATWDPMNGGIQKGSLRFFVIFLWWQVTRWCL